MPILLQVYYLHTVFNYINLYIIGLNSFNLNPNPRVLSNNFLNDGDSADSEITMAMAIWTIFIGHDLAHTGVTTMGMIHTLILIGTY